MYHNLLLYCQQTCYEAFSHLLLSIFHVSSGEDIESEMKYCSLKTRLSTYQKRVYINYILFKNGERLFILNVPTMIEYLCI